MKVMSTALLVLSLATPGVAQASTDVVAVQATSAATSAGKTVSVSCPNGTKVVGTGGAVTGERTTITRVRPSDDLTSAEVTAVEHGVGTVLPWTVTVRATCAPGEFTLASKSGTASAEAACPGTQKALGVAGETDGGHLTKMAPKNNLKGGLVEGSGTVTVHAICGTRPGLVLRGGTPTVVVTKTASKSVACQGDEQVVSAGGAVGGGIIEDVTPAGAGATVTGEGTDAQGQAIRWSITPYVVCSH
ncbi:hypothetical protein SAMN04488564_105253 [Lentzea waywayandensis]|uniref:Neocarzinostatin family protein n=2 Tax=Lentzea waywayandensis TaxID=84724 RepID=A0A1I6ESP6_9PSEU|nr:hypothetical protein SAMN04488564_105253 [Lentzea waywayandensis]